jgi:siroheme synthase-like protein
MNDSDKTSVPALPYILCLDLQNHIACVVGGGKVASRKVEDLLAAGAIVHVIADRLSEDLRGMLSQPQLAGRLFWHEGPYRRNLPARSRIVIACTDNREVNRQVRQDCRVSRMLCNVVDDPELCDFIVPSVRQIGRVQVAVSTGGASPTLARGLVEKYVAETNPAVALLADLLAQARLEVQARIPDTVQRKALLTELSGRESLEVCEQSGKDGWRQWFQRQLAQYPR